MSELYEKIESYTTDFKLIELISHDEDFKEA